MSIASTWVSALSARVDASVAVRSAWVADWCAICAALSTSETRASFFVARFFVCSTVFSIVATLPLTWIDARRLGVVVCTSPLSRDVANLAGFRETGDPTQRIARARPGVRIA